MATFTGMNGKAYKTADRPFAGGGEGDIFDVIGNPTYVAKIYKSDKRTTERERKLSAMVKIKPSVIEQYSWPLDVLYEKDKFAGYIMPKVVGKEKLRNIYVYDKRKGNPWTLYIAIAKNLSSAVYNVHEIGQVVGDLNPENILVDPKTGLVTLVDTDSYHITDQNGNVHRCGVGMPEYVAPELQGMHFPSAPLPTFTKETDLFSLSVLIFSLLMNGAHPFACKTISGSSSKFQPIDNLASGTCAYFTESSAPNIDIPRYAPALESLPKELQVLFKRAFVAGHKNPQLRPTAEEYYNVLETLENHIKVCTVNSEHLFYDNGNYGVACPWCKVDQKMRAIGQSAFVTGTIPSSSGSQAGTPTAPVQPSGHTFRPGTTTAPVKNNNWWKPVAGVAAVIVVIIIIVNSFGGKESPSVTVNNNVSPSVNSTTPSLNTETPNNSADNRNETFPSNNTPAPTVNPGVVVAPISDNKNSVSIISASEQNISQTDIQQISGSIMSEEQKDDYNFSPELDGTYRFEFSNVPEGTDLRLYILDSGGGTVTSDYDMDNGDGLTVKLSAGETYVLRVEQYRSTGSYTLNIGKKKPTVDITGYTATIDSIQYTDQKNDYLFIAPLDGTYRFEFSDVPDGTDLRLYVCNAGWETIKSDYDLDNGDGLTVQLTGGQSYYIQVTYYRSYGSYKLNIGYKKQTVDVTGLTAISDSIQYTDQKNDYSYTAAVEGAYRFEFSNVPDGTDFRLYVCNSGWETIKSDYDLDNGDGLTVRLSQGQTYFIQIVQYRSVGSYTLNIGQQKELVNITSESAVSDSMQFTEQENNYSFTATSGGKYKFLFSDVPDGTDLRLYIYNSGWETIKSDYDLDNEDSLTVDLSSGQTIYLRVMQYRSVGRYKLNISRE